MERLEQIIEMSEDDIAKSIAKDKVFFLLEKLHLQNEFYFFGRNFTQ